MKEKAEAFATGLVLFSYCSDEDVAMQGKNAALACMAAGTSSYERVETLEYSGGVLSPDNLRVYIDTPSMSEGTQAYAGTFQYVINAAAVDTSQADEDTPDGKFVNAGYKITLTFELSVNDNTGEQSYMISSVRVGNN